MLPRSVVLDALGRRAPKLVLAGTALLSLQNAILFSGFLVWLNDTPTGFAIGSASLWADVPAVVLLGLGILGMASRASAEGAAAGLARGSGLLFLGWALLTAAWRWALPASMGRSYADVFDGILGAGEGLPGWIAGNLGGVQALLVLWAAASLAFVGAVLLLRFEGGRSVGDRILDARVDLRTWEGFVVVSATGTVLIVAEMLGILGGGTAGGLLTAGLALKVAVAPLNGTFAYAFLARRAWRLVQEESRKEPPASRVMPVVPEDGGDL